VSDEDQSGDNKSFLARWSQRKREAKQPEPKPDAPAAEAEIQPGPLAEADAAPELDLSSLPKLEDLTGTTDITGFLRKGVPEHLRNAALRKSWALDPAIRNYVNPALEYAYDWNTPGGVPGSSEIGAGMDVARLVAPSAEHHAAQVPAPDLPGHALRLTDASISAAQKPANADEGAGLEAGRSAVSEVDNAVAPQQAVRRHGSAKPLV
jgi:hypothetical protein